MTLTQVALLTKQVITISIFALMLATTFFIGYKIWNAYNLTHLPPVEEKPDTSFGILPYPDFPKTEVSSSNFSYSIDTVTGGLPKLGEDPGFEKLIKVYFVTKPFATFLSAEKSQVLAEKFAITNEPQIITETNYLFKNQDSLLSVDLDSGNFTYRREASISAKESLDNDSKLTSDFKATLNSLGVLKPQLSEGKSKVTMVKKEEAQVAQISLWSANLDDKPIVTPDFNKSPVNALVYKSAEDIQNYLSLNFTYYPVDSSTFATYPIKSAETALGDLRLGKGAVIIEPPKPNVSITSVYLGYFQSENYSPYLQPIFIFEGPNFVAYVPAISEQFQSPAR